MGTSEILTEEEVEFAQFLQNMLYPDLILSTYFERFPIPDQIYPHLAQKSRAELQTLFENYAMILQQGLTFRSKLIARMAEVGTTERTQEIRQKQMDRLDGFLRQVDAHNSRIAVLGMQLYLKMREIK